MKTISVKFLDMKEKNPHVFSCYQSFYFVERSTMNNSRLDLLFGEKNPFNLRMISTILYVIGFFLLSVRKLIFSFN